MDSRKNGAFSRRDVVGAVTTGAVALGAVSSQAAAQGRTVRTANLPVPGPQKSGPAYPEPPFPPQRQEWPGLTGKMEPVPDHGETSYVGSGRLQERKALITGGDSGIGRAAAIAYAREGADVAINYFPTEEPDAREVVALIQAEGRRAVAIPGDIRDEAFCGQRSTGPCGNSVGWMSS